MIISLSYILQLCWDMIKILHIRILSQIWSKMQAMNYISSWSFYAAVFFSSVQFSRSVMSNSATLWAAAHQAALSITNSRSLLKLVSIESMMSSNHLPLCLLRKRGWRASRIMFTYDTCHPVNFLPSPVVLIPVLWVVNVNHKPWNIKVLKEPNKNYTMETFSILLTDLMFWSQVSWESENEVERDGWSNEL